MQWTKSIENLLDRVPLGKARETVLLRLFGLAKIPLLFLVSPKVLEVSEERCSIKIPLNRLTKNHLGSMYFGVLAIGADCAAGLIGMNFIRASGRKVALIFKDFHADFIRRAEDDVIFTCDQGPAISDLVARAVASGERVNLPVNIVACAASDGEPVAKFILTMSLKVKN